MSDMFRRVRPVPPPESLRARVLATALRSADPALSGRRRPAAWTRLDLAWAASLVLLVGAHAAITLDRRDDLSPPTGRGAASTIERAESIVAGTAEPEPPQQPKREEISVERLLGEDLA